MTARVLVIEDNPNNLDLISYLLGAFGHTVLAARDGESGLKVIEEDRPDLVVCDLHLPGIDGYGVARALKRDPALRSIPLVAVTALAMVGDRDKVLAAGFDGYLTKPIDPEKFVEQIDGFLPSAIRSAVPTQPAPAAAQLPESSDAPPGAAILLVDNVSENIALLLSLLGNLGLQLLTARSVAQALEMARERKLDLIVSDIHMPGNDGYGLLRGAHADPALRGVPVVLITASFRFETEKILAREFGAVDVIPRDLDTSLMRARILACLPANVRPDCAGTDRGGAHGDHPCR